MKVLIACEESQEVCKAFRRMGDEAYSCDILPCSGGHPEWHIQEFLEVIIHSECWDAIIGFPPCTYLTVTGNRWFDIKKYGVKAQERYNRRKQAISFFMQIANAKCPRIAIENPIGVMSTKFRKPDQIIQPYEFGDPYEKRTCLWIKGLPKLRPTNIVRPPSRKKYKGGTSMPKWYSDLWNLPKQDRTKLRSKTFPGIAKAMASQWHVDDILL